MNYFGFVVILQDIEIVITKKLINFCRKHMRIIILCIIFNSNFNFSCVFSIKNDPQLGLKYML